MSGASLIKRFSRNDIGLIRKGPGGYVDGYWVEGAIEMIGDPPAIPLFEGSVQELSQKELMLLPEGDRTKRWIKIYTVLVLRTQAEHQNSDIVVVDGVQYQVMNVSNQFTPGAKMKLLHYRYECSTMNEKTVESYEPEVP